jgi:acyl-CoA thioesterase II
MDERTMPDPAGDFAADTVVSGADGRYRATLSDAWALWGPAGGYVSTIALRAAGAYSRFDRPASYSCSYLGVADFGPIDIDVTALRSAKRAEALRVTLMQHDQPFLDATVWTIDAGMGGLEHDDAPMPEVPAPDGLAPWLRPEGSNPYARFWSNLEERMIHQWFGEWREHPVGPPIREGWYRFRPSATFDDPYLDAGRSLMIVDTLGWPAAVVAYPGEVPWAAPTIELSVRFHRLAPSSEWLFGVTKSPVATDGLLGSTAKVWSQEGSLVASGGQHMLFRPV